jgi:pSer/pThr/pTyr-binding forkhead associated (FHA) protein
MADKDVNKDKDDTGELNDPNTGAPKADSAETETEKGVRSIGASALTKENQRLQAAMEERLQKDDLTSQLTQEDLAGLPETSRMAFGTQPDRAKWYRKLPINMGTAEIPPDVPRWRVEIDGLGPTVEPTGLDIIGDAVLGRGRVGSQPADFDFDQFGALEQGVSRRHALLRPTANHLYIIDLGSTNGTLHNGLPLGPGIARSLKNSDTVTLGRLSFTIKIIDGPGLHRSPSAPADAPEEGDSTRPLTTETGGVAAPYVSPTETNRPKITQEIIDAYKKKEEEKNQQDK